jgi:hypothetical protein
MADANKIMDALMSADPMQLIVAQGLISRAKDHMADSALLARAVDLHASDDIELDDEAATAEADKGTWVAAWVWVPLPEAEDDESDASGEDEA